MTIRFAQEKLETFFPDARALLVEHWGEIAEKKDLLRLDPDMMRYGSLEKNNVLHIVTARDEGRLVGYYAGLVNTHLHYKSVVVGIDDVYFIHPAYRDNGLGTRLFLAVEELLRMLKADISVVKVKLRHDHDKLLTSLGYEPFERVYWKALGLPVSEGVGKGH